MKGKLLTLSPGPVGDHLMFLEDARRFYFSNKIRSIILIKNNFDFLFGLSEGYLDFCKIYNFNSIKGFLALLRWILSSFFLRNYLIYHLPTPYKNYLIIFGNFLQYFTRTRVVSFVYSGMSRFVPPGLHLKGDINHKMYFEETDDAMKKIKLKTFAVNSKDYFPRFLFKVNPYFKKENNLEFNYVIIHPTPSHIERRLSDEKWKKVFKNIIDSSDRKIIFTGAKKDSEYVEHLCQFLPKGRYINFTDNKSPKKLIDLFDHADELFMVHTGPTHLANLMHKKVTIFCHLWLKQFDFAYNKNAEVIILSKVLDVQELHKTQGVKVKYRL